MFGRRKKAKSFTDELEAQPVFHTEPEVVPASASPTDVTAAPAKATPPAAATTPPTQSGTSPGPLTPPPPPQGSDGKTVVVQGSTIEIPGGGGTIEFPQTATIIDARGVQGLRGDMLKAVEDMRAGNSAGPEELKAVIAKAMSVRNAYLAQAGIASPDGTVAGTPGVSPVDAPAAPEDPLERLERLNNLRLAGTLTDAEFEEQKQKILGEM